MTDDIVTRLRDNCACGIGDEFGIMCASCTAADEIERLRHKLSKWLTMLPNSLVCSTHGSAHIYHYGFNDGYECGMCKEGKDYKHD